MQELFRLDTGLLALGQVVEETCDDSDWPLDHANKMTTLMYQVGRGLPFPIHDQVIEFWILNPGPQTLHFALCSPTDTVAAT